MHTAAEALRRQFHQESVLSFGYLPQQRAGGERGHSSPCPMSTSRASATRWSPTPLPTTDCEADPSPPTDHTLILVAGNDDRDDARRLVSEAGGNWNAATIAYGRSGIRGAPARLLPLDGAGRFAGDVQHHAVDLGHLVGDAGRDALQHLVGHPGPIGGHGVLAGHRPQHDRVPVGAAVALHTDRADVGQQHHRALPDLVVQTGRGQLLARDRVGAAQRVQPLRGDLADDPDAQSRPRKWLARNDFLRQTQFPADGAHLVFEQQPQRLDEFELQVVGQAADVVVALDVRGAAAPAGLHHVGIQRALHQELDVIAVAPNDIPHRALEGPDELPADDLALALGVGHARQRLEEGRPPRRR